MKKVLVIGGSGFLGKHVIEYLQKLPCEVYAVRHVQLIPGVVDKNQISGGIRAVNHQLIDNLKPDLIFHLARPVIPRFRRAGRFLAAVLAYRNNQKLISVLKGSEPKPHLVFASGSLMYGSSLQPHDEDSPVKPISFARQYYIGEVPVVKAAISGSYPVTIFRLPWLLGDGSWFKWFYIENIRNKGCVPAFGDQENMMEIIDIRDAAKLVSSIVMKNMTSGIINVPSVGAISQKEFLEMVASVFNAKVVDYRKLYPGKIEKEVLEAFTSNILLTTRHRELFQDYNYTPVFDALRKIHETRKQ